MADMMQFDLVSPERNLLSTQATQVQIPGAAGDLTAMPNHAPLITTLRPGVLTVATDKGEQEFVVTGGFAQLGEGLSVLAEKALPKADVDQAAYDEMVAEAQAAYNQAKEAGAADDAAKTLQDMIAVAGQIGLSAAVAAL
jgi:F-type H+-transporting ATPase subunit epsilon